MRPADKLEGVTFSGNQAYAGVALFATQGAITATNILSNAAAFAITADYETWGGYGSAGARAGEDYVAATGTLTFSPEQTTKNFTVQVIGDTRGEADEIFWAELKNATAPVAGNVNSATIRNDDDFRQLLPLIQR